MVDLNRDSQPPEAINYSANLKKATESLLGICRGLIADQAINEHEVTFLDAWLKENDMVVHQWPGNVIAERVQNILADGVVTEEEAQDLADTLAEITGTDLSQGVASGLSNQLETDTDSGGIIFEGRTFCFTGKFIYGTRRRVADAVKQLGGFEHSDATKDVDYVVIGGLASRDWAHTSHGRKIEKAIGHRDQGVEIAIVEEDEWTAALNTARRHL